MNGACYGYQQGNRIAVNVDMLNDGVFRTTYSDAQGNLVTKEHAVPAVSWSVYDTIVHEHTHGVSMDRDQAPYTYFAPETDSNLYRIQDEERLAYDAGEKATLEAINRAEAAMGKADPEKADYLNSIQEESYEECLENAKLAYNDPEIDKTLAQFIADQDQGIIPENRSDAYRQLQAAYNKQIAQEIQGVLDWDKTTVQPPEQSKAVLSAEAPVHGHDGVMAPTAAEPASYGNDGADMSAAAEPASYENDGSDMSAAAEPASYENDGSDMSAAAEPVSYENDGADMSAAAEPASYENDGADMSAGDSSGSYDGGNDGGMDNN